MINVTRAAIWPRRARTSSGLELYVSIKEENNHAGSEGSEGSEGRGAAAGASRRRSSSARALAGTVSSSRDDPEDKGLRKTT